MICPHCESPVTTKRQGPTSLGSRRFRCQACGRRFNERSGTPLNDLQYPTDVVLLAVLRRLRDTLSCRDIAELRFERGFSVTPETIREWECRCARGASLSGSARFCSAFDELRHYFRARQRRGQSVPLAEQRRLFVTRWRSLIAEMAAAWTTPIARGPTLDALGALRSDRTSCRPRGWG